MTNNWFCIYCGGSNDAEKHGCSHCGAPRKEQTSDEPLRRTDRLVEETHRTTGDITRTRDEIRTLKCCHCGAGNIIKSYWGRSISAICWHCGRGVLKDGVVRDNSYLKLSGLLPTSETRNAEYWDGRDE